MKILKNKTIFFASIVFSFFINQFFSLETEKKTEIQQNIQKEVKTELKQTNKIEDKIEPNNKNLDNPNIQIKSKKTSKNRKAQNVVQPTYIQIKSDHPCYQNCMQSIKNGTYSPQNQTYNPQNNFQNNPQIMTNNDSANYQPVVKPYANPYANRTVKNNVKPENLMEPFGFISKVINGALGAGVGAVASTTNAAEQINSDVTASQYQMESDQLQMQNNLKAQQMQNNTNLQLNTIQGQNEIYEQEANSPYYNNIVAEPVQNPYDNSIYGPNEMVVAGRKRLLKKII